jgi:chemotaxis protein CheX
VALTEESFYQMIQDTWVSTFGIQVERVPSPEPLDDSPITVGVKISGAWYGAVCLQRTVSLGRLVAAVIFQIDGDKAGSEDIVDALGELVHIIGGNLKSLLPQPVTLSLPFRFDSTTTIQSTLGEQMVCRLAVQSSGHPFLVTFWEILPRPETENSIALTAG